MDDEVHQKELSFITPIRNRNEQIPGLIHNLNFYYKECEIIFAHQSDNKAFKHGQLRNLGFKKSTGRIVVFIDVDVRLFDFVDFVELQKEYNYSLLMFDISYEIKENALGVYQRYFGRTCSHCIGRLLCFTREQFEECGGYSNLCAGWSWEDDLLFKRAQCVKVPGKIGHVTHQHQRDMMKHVSRNRKLCDTDNRRLRKSEKWENWDLMFSDTTSMTLVYQKISNI
jgi:glycosyltransferase involved in cell wall biosynthesis